jgi:hypothetical protein
LACPERKGRWRGRPGAARIAAAPGRAEQRGGRRKEGGEGEADQWDPIVSERERKEKEGGGVGWRGEGLMGRWAAGPKRRGGFPVVFFFFSFSNSFQINLLNSNSTKFLLNFSQNFIIFLEVTQATKNHAKPNNDAQSLVVSILIKLSLIF